ncbi:unannotated protein [freshwater metagenome]|uniref:Unannotated protein n=1 Tax=freshwater metagenome TaxID=449393 RepID=A0A6J7JZ13_9ZZZZ
MSASPVSTKIVIPKRGRGDINNLVNSSRIRSAEIMEILPAIPFIACKTSGAISKPNWLAKRAARIIRSGSSEKEFSAVVGVRNIFCAKSAKPLYGSINSGTLVVNSRAIALTVKSRRDKSPSIFSPYTTSGLRLAGS